MNETEPKYFTNFKKELFEKLDGHEDQIVKVSEQATMISKDITKLQTDMTKMQGDMTKMQGDVTTMNGHMVIVINEIRWKKDKDERPRSELSLV